MKINNFKNIFAKLKIENWILIFILLLSLILRVWNLGSNPPGLTPDEASLGYNAYSILKTGRDEYGKVLPVIFKSFGDYKPGLYVYLTVPFIAVFGLNEWSVRLPSAIAGVVAVWLLYLIVKEFIKDKEFKIENLKLEFLAPALLAVAPWSIYFSRGAWEVNLSLTLTLAGILFFLKAFYNTKYLISSAIFFALTIITYQGAKLSTLIVLLVLLVIYYKKILILFKDNFKIVSASIFIALIISAPSILSFVRGQTGRLTVFSIFSYPRSDEYLQYILSQNNEKKGDINYLLFHNETLNFKRAILGRYFNYFSGRFLLFEGDYQNPRHSAPNSGMLLLFDLILLPFGIWYVIKRNGKISAFIFLWLFLSPLPGALTRDQVQAVRAYQMVIPLTLISAFGLAGLLQIIKSLSKNSITKLFLLFTLLTLLFVGSFVYFLDAYFIHLPIHNAKYWEYGYKEVIQKLIPIQNNYKTIYFQQSYNQPYIYYLFYSKYDPAKYQKNAKLSNFLGPDVGLVENLDNISFVNWSWPYATGEKSTLLIGDNVAIPSDYNRKDYNLVSEIKYPDGFMTAFRIVETK